MSYVTLSEATSEAYSRSSDPNNHLPFAGTARISPPTSLRSSGRQRQLDVVQAKSFENTGTRYEIAIDGVGAVRKTVTVQ